MNRAEWEYNRLIPYLPAVVPSLLDVGCGGGNMASQFALHSGTTNVHLLDGSSGDLGEKRMGYHLAGKPWRSTDKAVNNVRKSAPNADIHVYTPDNEWPNKVDLIISFWSWGFHYPIDTYLDRAAKIGAPLILDIRNSRLAQSTKELRRAGYDLMSIIDTSRKAVRALVKCTP